MNERDVFNAALSIQGGSARQAYLDDACAGNEALRQRVEALCKAHEVASRFLEQPVFAAGQGPTGGPSERPQGDGQADLDRTAWLEHPAKLVTVADAEESAPSLDFLAPSDKPGSLGRLAHYEVLEVLGKGGFGIVVKAFDEKLHRMVAIKVMERGLAATSPPRKRFLREARASAAIRHENVVNIYAVDEQPVPHLVMEYIAGQTLQQKLDQSGPIELAEVLRIGYQIADGLAAAHSQGLIHRDIKPGNILLEAGVERVKITDFGLARAADDASLTQSGVIAGTPMYMAPEQALGESIDQRADLFSLGSVLYVMCTGRPPFRASTTMAVLKRVAEDTPRPIREIISDVPEWLCAIITHLHAKDPADRFASAQEVADLLKGHLAALQSPRGVHPVLVPPSPSTRPKPAAFDSEFLTKDRLPKAGRRSNDHRLRPVFQGLLVLATVVIAGFGMTNLARFTNVRRTIVRLVASKETPRVKASAPVSPATSLGPWGEFLDPQGGCRASREGDRLTITVPGDSPRDLNPNPGFTLDAPRALQPVTTDFTIRVTVLPFPRPGPLTTYTNGIDSYHGAGLVIWADDRNLLRFELAGQAQTSAGAPYTHLEQFRDGRKVDEELRWTDAAPTHLEIERRGDTLQLRTSTDGESWADYKTCTFAGMSQRVLVGVAAINSEAKEFTTQFEGWSLRSDGAESHTPGPALELPIPPPRD